jgi:hypothetical protein
MSFPIATYPHHHDKSSFGQNYEHLDADFFDQFLTFDPTDIDVRNCPSELLESCSTSVTPEGEHIDQELWPNQSAWDQISGSSQYQFYSESTGRAAISDSELLSLEGITLHSPETQSEARFHSLPSSPVRNEAAVPSRATRMVNSLARKLRKSSANIENTFRSPIRKTSSSLSVNRKPSIWAQKLDSSKFDFDLQELPRPLSPVTPAKIPTTPKMVHRDSAKYAQVNSNMEFSHVDYENVGISTGPCQTSQSTPLLDSSHSRRTAHDFPPTPQQPQQQQQQQLQQQQHHPNGWTPITHNSEYNHFMSPDVPMWYSHASTAPMAQPSPTALHLNPQCATKSLAMHLQNEISYGSNERNFIPPLPSGLILNNPPQLTQQLQQPFCKPPSYHSRSKSYQETRQKLPPTRESESPSPKSFQRRRKGKGRAESKSEGNIGGMVDFVNFTPQDSKKILTGVAPSGSSKTKARREREAMEKRRKLSQAALRAVRAAGGDVESLVEEGLLV